ncbi:MAG: aminopeptidase [Clostridia bacterium]|nr:aminopeptidase [Clostridia bacterium]
MERPNAWKTYNKSELKKLEDFAKAYKAFIDAGKTERECVVYTVAALEKAGYINLEKAIAEKKALKAGDKVYVNKMGKAVLTFHIGKKPLAEGMNIVGAHIDSPRLDLKQNPLYEDGDFALADTHYYGGIKKYQWVARELALHGVVVKKDGTTVNISIGEKEDDPVVGISDLLPHLAQDQMGKKLSEAIPGENLDIILGGKPLKDEEKEPVKAQILQILKDSYGIEEEDFISAEIEVVPAGKARDFGLDRSMIIGYGHDDRVCAFAELEAVLSLKGVPAYTCCGMLVDKEEIGSVGATGMRSNYLENAVAEILDLLGEYSELNVRRALQNSRMLSCDVSAGFDPLYASAYEKKNSAWLGRGVCFNKFTGSRGKSGSNDANAEYMAKLRKIMDDNKVCWQTAELGKVDQGGGGTIAYICALYGMEVIDSGVAVLNMHAPMEVISKADLYESFKAYKAFMING